MAGGTPAGQQVGQTMQGMNKSTGKRLYGVSHLRQSIQDILSTPLGTRVMRPEYGSRLPQLIDRPVDDVLLVDRYAATAEALENWEPRFALRRVQAFQPIEGRITLSVEGLYLPDNDYIKMEGLEL